MALFGLKTKASQKPKVSENLERFVRDFSIEVMPRTAEKIENFSISGGSYVSPGLHVCPRLLTHVELSHDMSTTQRRGFIHMAVRIAIGPFMVSSKMSVCLAFITKFEI